MPDIKLANHPSRAYNSETLFHYMHNNASFNPNTQDMKAITRALGGLQNYFNDYCREGPALTVRGVTPTPNSSLDR